MFFVSLFSSVSIVSFLNRHFPTFTGAYQWLVSQHEKDFKIRNLESKMEELESTVESLEEFKTKFNALEYASVNYRQKPFPRDDAAPSLFEEAKECVEDLLNLSDDDSDLKMAARVLDAYEEYVLSEQVDSFKGRMLDLLTHQSDRVVHRERLKRHLRLAQESLNLNAPYPIEEIKDSVDEKYLLLYVKALKGLRKKPSSDFLSESHEKYFRTFLQCLEEEF